MNDETMSESGASVNALRAAFGKCRDELENRPNGVNTAALISEKIRLARLINDKVVYMGCFDDIMDVDPESEFAWEMLKKAADLGEIDALRQVAEWYCNGDAPEGVDFNKAAQYALEYVRCGGGLDGSELIGDISPNHNALIDTDITEPLIEAALKIEPTPSRKYYLARCLWDIENEMRLVLSIPEWINKVKRNEKTPEAITLYREAADEGYFWAKFFLGMYLALGSGSGKPVGISYLEAAKKNMPINECSSSEQRDELREVAEIIEKTLFACTGKISNRVRMLEGQLRQGNLSAAPELVVAYMKGEECPKDRDKAFDCAAGVLFHDEEFAELVHLMHDLPDNDRVWLEKKLNAEAQKVEAEEVNGSL